MTEILEYSLVIMVSTLFVVGSVVTYSSFASFMSGLQLRLASASISRLAADAVENGSASGALDVPPSTISCQGGELNLASGGLTEGQGFPVNCDFSLKLQGGTHTFGFLFESQQLSLMVT